MIFTVPETIEGDFCHIVLSFFFDLNQLDHEIEVGEIFRLQYSFEL